MLSPAELQAVWTAIANHKAHLDPGFVRKLSARWEKVYKIGGAAVDHGFKTVSRSSVQTVSR